MKKKLCRLVEKQYFVFDKYGECLGEFSCLEDALCCVRENVDAGDDGIDGFIVSECLSYVLKEEIT